MTQTSNRITQQGAPNPPFDLAKRKQELIAKSLAMGLTAECLGSVVDRFYEKIRANDELGPLFERTVQGNWPRHLEKMKAFWRSVCLYDGSYSGKPVPAHKALSHVKPSHFDTWLKLFDQALTEEGLSEDAHAFVFGRAENIAESLKLAMFETNSIPIPRVSLSPRI